METLQAKDAENLTKEEKTELDTLRINALPRLALQSELNETLKAQQKKLDQIENDLVENFLQGLSGKEIDAKYK